MENEQSGAKFQRLMSEESTSSVLSTDSCEYYQTEIFGQLPSSQTHRRQQQRIHPDAVSDETDHQFLLDRDWDPRLPLRALPVCMQDKKNIRERHRERRHQRGNSGSWESWRRSQQITCRRLKEHVGGALSGLLPWRQTLHRIEGQFGVGVKAYFVFLRYLLCLNLFYCLIIAGTVVMPTQVFRGTLNKHDKHGHQNVSFGYKDIFIGSGFLEISPVFHSFYTRGSLHFDCLNTPILFLLGMVSVLFLSLIMVVRRTVVGYKHSWLTGNHFSWNVSYKVFCGWDFCIQNTQSASVKQKFIRNELKMDLEEQTFHQRVQQRSLKQRVQLVFLRVVLNFLVLVLLGSSFVLIHYTIQLEKPKSEHSGLQSIVSLFFEYLPPVTMATINYVLPQIFSKISEFEDYSLTSQLNLTLIRSIFLKLASLGIYLFFLITSPKGNKGQTAEYLCAENDFGKEMYKLSMVNFLECFFSAFFLAYPRTLLVERYPSSTLAKLLGKLHFEIPLNVLDLVNSQTVTWVGVFYCPLLPAISAVRLLCVFYMKKFTVVRCCVPAQRMCRTSSSSVLFHFMLLLGLFMSVVTLGVNINRFIPGGCGPFEGNRTVFNVTGVCIETLPGPAQTAIRYISSEAFAFALILAEVVILTSYVSRGRANRKAIERLKDMLVMCSSDKRFLVKQHSTLMRRQQRTH